MRRREFLQHLGIGATLAAVASGRESSPVVHTVRGPIAVAELGRVLPHEHVLVDFVGADRIADSRYDADEVFRVALPHLQRARELGVRTVFECTPDFLGRNPQLLRRLSVASDLHLITNTGLYGARRNIFLPRYAHEEPAAQLAARWIREANEGIGETGIRPGFIKCGVDAEPALSAMHRKLVTAAALTHTATGLTIAVHTGRGPGREQLDILREHGVAPAAFVWVHAQGASDDELFAAADRGAWISCDGLNRPTLARHLALCTELKKRGHVGRVMLSHDAGWFDPAKPQGGTFRPFDLLLTTFVPMLRDHGFSDAEIDQLTIKNPAEAFAIRVRKT
jgi:phosphotriesterase-related protein